jgi:hypothetical protein
MKYSTFFSIITLGLCAVTFGAEFKITSAKITELVPEKVFIHQDSKDKGQKAKENDEIKDNKLVRTVSASRAELEFNDKSIARLGANTVFSFQPQSRNMKFEKGVLLFQQPKGQGKTQIATPAATCAIVGTTVQMYNVGNESKFLVLEGSMIVTTPEGVSYNLKPGSLLVLLNDGNNTKPVIDQIDIAAILNGPMVRDFKRELKSMDEIKEAINAQGGFQAATVDEGHDDKAAGTDTKSTGLEIISRPDAGLPRREEVVPDVPQNRGNNNVIPGY